MGLFAPALLRPLNGTPVPSSQTPPLLTPHRRDTTPTSSTSHTAVNPPLLRTPHTPVHVAPQTPVRPAPQMRSNLESTSNSPRRDPAAISIPSSSMQRNIAPALAFYVVIAGGAPGVYGLL